MIRRAGGMTPRKWKVLTSVGGTLQGGWGERKPKRCSGEGKYFFCFVEGVVRLAFAV